MKIWNSILQARGELAKSKANTVVTIGNFDGVHRGHQAIIQRTVELAEQGENLALTLTFLNHTEGLWGEKPFLLNMPSIRRELLARLGLNFLLEIEFEANFAALEPEVFFQTWLIDALKVKTLVIGHDFHFGAGDRGDYHLLQELGAAKGVAIERLAPVYQDGTIISSSRIRELLAEGRIDHANQLLGYPFVIEGEVVTGEQRGRKLGYPTANIHLEPEFLLPCYGVYLVRLTSGTTAYFGIANVGIKPTFGKFSPLVEVYLFDLELNLYHQLVRVEFLKFIRPENRFSGPEALKTQIANDIQIAKSFLV